MIVEQMMFHYARIVIPFNSFCSETKNFEMFPYSDFKIALSFPIVGSIATTTLKFLNSIRTVKQEFYLQMSKN